MTIKRDSLISALKRYKIHPTLIDITKIYKDDKTTITLPDSTETEVQIRSGIRQGCTGSTTLFKSITYIIMQELEQSKNGFSNKKFNTNSLFFADDGLLPTVIRAS